jgi:subtilisin family serine protease
MGEDSLNTAQNMNAPIIRKSQKAALTFGSILLVLGATAGVEPATAAPPHVEGELLVKFAGGPRGAAAEHARNQMRHEVKRNFDRIGWQHIRLPKGMTVEEGLARYAKLPNVLAVEPNGIMEIVEPIFNPVPEPEVAPVSAIPNDPQFSTQWNLRLLEMTNAWAVTPGSPEVVVAVLDSGIDYLHEDLRDNMWRNLGETGTDNQGQDKATNGIDDDGNGYIDDVHGIDVVDGDSDPMDLGSGGPRETGRFHGTACAGIIGATGNNAIGMAGVNWTVRLMAVRVSTTNGAVPYANSLAGVEYLIAMKERGVNIRASNHSYGDGGSGFNQARYDAGLAHQAAGHRLGQRRRQLNR